MLGKMRIILLSAPLLLSSLLSMALCSPSETIKLLIKNQNNTTTLPEVALNIDEYKSITKTLNNDSDAEYFPTVEAIKDSSKDELLKLNTDSSRIGIRSFTVEITKDEKLITSISPNETQRERSSSHLFEKDQERANNGTLSSPPVSNRESADNVEPLKIKNLDPTSISTSSSSSLQFLNSLQAELLQKEKMNGTKNNRSHENEFLGKEREDQKIYRTKIGEITTGDFVNVKNHEDSQHLPRDQQPNDIPVHHEQLKVNIDDFFPSIIRDFNPMAVSGNVELNSKIQSGTRINTSKNIANRDMEIELIEDKSSLQGNAESKNIQFDGAIPQLVEVMTDDAFIPQRVKKLNNILKTNGGEFSRLHDFGMTKFNQDNLNKTLSLMAVSGNSEFSTTKFYNTKQPEKNLNTENQSSKLPMPVHDVKTTPFASKITTKIEDSLLKIAAKVLPPMPTTSRQLSMSRFQEKLNFLDCDLQNLSPGMTVWRGNETHELNLPMTTPRECSSNDDCVPLTFSWEATAEIQSGDVLIVEIDDKILIPTIKNESVNNEIIHHNNAAVYQVTRLGHEHCDITEGELLDITPLVVDGKKLVTLYDKDLTEGINLLIVVSEIWAQQCVRLRVNVKSDNCGENAECSGKGICFSNVAMEGYECECCIGFSGPHCEEIDACTPSPCTNNGICVDLSQGHDGNSYQCLCPYGYNGKNCETETDPCSPSQCMNGGTCITNTTHFRIGNSTLPFRCECPQGFTGPLCQHNLNECESSPCVHGICVDQEDGFRCFCQPGFSGDLCNFEYNECDSNPCVNGLCIDHIGTYSCQCSKGYQGKRCHIKIDFCANNPCEDGYRCVDHGDEYSCVCPGSGDHNVPCDEVPRTLCTTNPCANGGTCWTSDESFYCACRPGFIGNMCEDDFVVDTVVSSSELLSDISDSNVITFGESHESLQPNTSNQVNHVIVTAGIFVVSLLALVSLVTLVHCNINKTWKKLSGNYRQIIPSCMRNRSYNEKKNPHWLSGKGQSIFEENQINLKNNTQLHHNSNVSNSQIFNGPFQMNIENDMYFSVDFSESHQSLIK